MTDPIQAAIDELERRAREFMEKSQKCTEAAATIRAALADFNAPVAYVAGADVAAARTTSRSTSPQSRLKAAGVQKQQATETVVREALLSMLRANKHSGPQRSAIIYSAVRSATKAPDSVIKRVLERLRAEDQVIATGKRAGMRYGLPGATPVAPAPPPAAAAPAKSSTIAVLTALKSGASKGADEIVAETSLPAGEVKHALQVLADAKRVDKLISASGDVRYRLRAGTAA